VPTTEADDIGQFYYYVKASYFDEYAVSASAALVTVKAADSSAGAEGPGSLAKTIDLSNKYWSYGDGWVYSQTDRTFTIFTSGTGYVVTGDTRADSSSNGNRVVVAAGVTATVTLHDATIDLSASTEADSCAFALSPGANVTLVLSGENTLKSGGDRTYSDDVFGTRKPGVLVPEGASLTITSNLGAGSESGVLTAVAKVSGAGIGGEFGGTVGAINIEGGTIYATGGWNDFYDDDDPGWKDGDLSTYPDTGSGMSGAGIGGGGYTGRRESGTLGYGAISISGGKIVAVSVSPEDRPCADDRFGVAYGAAGIGGGAYNLGGGTITITGGDITATAVYSTWYQAYGAYLYNGAAGIGGGGGGQSGDITINGGKGTANGTPSGLGFGSSRAVGPSYQVTPGAFILNGTQRAAFPGANIDLNTWSWDASAGTVSDKAGCGAWNP
jgi:hypothetical protein